MFQVTYESEDGSLVSVMCPDFRIRLLPEGCKARPTCGLRHSKTVINSEGKAVGWIEVEPE